MSTVGVVRSPVPHFDRSDSVTPTNEFADEESLTPHSVSTNCLIATFVFYIMKAII